jgi:hypothetical protein
MGNSWSFTETPKHLQKSSKTKSIIWTFEDFTEDAPDDGKIKKGVKGIQMSIWKHTDYYYHDEKAQCKPEEIEEILVKTSPTLPNFSPKEFAHLLCDARSRHAAICAYISHMVTKNMEFTGSRTDTLLVPCILDCMAELQVGDPHIQLSEGILTSLSYCGLIADTRTEDEAVFAQWRAVTAHFLSKGRNAERVQDDKKERIHQLVQAINEILVHFTVSDEDGARRLEGLRSIVVRGKEVGQLIFASPSRWIFDWNPFRQIREENRRQDDTQSRKLRKPNEPYRRRKKRIRGRPLVIVLFPALDQRFNQALDDKHSYDTHQSPGDYEDSEDIRDAMRDLRSLGLGNAQDELSQPARSESHVSGSSQGTSIVKESKALEP